MKQFIAVFGPAAMNYDLAGAAGLAGKLFRGNVSMEKSVGRDNLEELLSTQRTELKKPIPEMLVMGRSNVGKSSLINALVGMKVARTSKTPGRTQRLFFYHIEQELVLVDAPGYGFAVAPSSECQKWQEVTSRYLLQSPRLHLVICLIHASHGIKMNDKLTFDALAKAEKRFLIVLTKADKVHNLPNALQTVYEATKCYRNRVEAIHAVSSREELGLETLRTALAYYVRN